MKEALVQFYGDDPQRSPDYGRIVNLYHFDRLVNLLASGTIYHGGQHDRIDRFIAPTVLVNVPPNSPVMQEEIFGPILPVLEVDGVQQVIDFLNARPAPLGLYIFAEDPIVSEQVLGLTTSGMRRSTIAPYTRLLTICHSELVSRGWASITASGDFVPIRMPEAF